MSRIREFKNDRREQKRAESQRIEEAARIAKEEYEKKLQEKKKGFFRSTFSVVDKAFAKQEAKETEKIVEEAKAKERMAISREHTEKRKMYLREHKRQMAIAGVVALVIIGGSSAASTLPKDSKSEISRQNPAIINEETIAKSDNEKTTNPIVNKPDLTNVIIAGEIPDDAEEKNAQGLSDSKTDSVSEFSYNVTVISDDVVDAAASNNIEIPEYSGHDYAAVNNGIPYFTENDLTQDCFVNLSKLDSLGRAGTAYANLHVSLMPTEARGSINIKPSGWQLVRYDDIIEDRYLYNRCHLIGYQFIGNNEKENLITGTRYFNVSGMLSFETSVAKYLRETSNHVLYRVTPYYSGDNLVADGVLMEAMSVEDNGRGICFNAFVYNIQPGITIHYLTGESTPEIQEKDPAVEISNPGEKAAQAGHEVAVVIQKESTEKQQGTVVRQQPTAASEETGTVKETDVIDKQTTDENPPLQTIEEAQNSTKNVQNTDQPSVKSESSGTSGTSGSKSGVTVPTQADTQGNLVWIPTKGGTKYHSHSGCSGMIDPIQVTVEHAEANGYTPCKKCY